MGGGGGNGLEQSGSVKVAGYCEYGDYPSGSIKNGEFFLVT
jgi:hypothetical protein